MMSSTQTLSVADAHGIQRTDAVAVEEPLEMRVGYGPQANRDRATAAITMRTPGHDADLAVGFLFTEGVIDDAADIVHIECLQTASVVRVDLRPDRHFDESRLKRNSYISSSCGVCGKTSLDAVESLCGPVNGMTVDPAVIHALPAKLQAAQTAFATTGGLHAAALFDRDGRLLNVREDVGRHNALDKLIGHEVRAGRSRLNERIVLVSGRASFELVQKAAMAGVPMLAAVGAPSSLAVQLAQRVGITLLGFVRDHRFNVYTVTALT
jgi:FdhD protein